MIDYSTVLIDIEPNGIATIRLNRPDVRNALNSVLIKELTQVITDCDKNKNVRAIILQGEGKLFCAGADLAYMQEMATFTHDQNIADAQRLGHLFETLDTCSKPTLAIVHGGAYGGGVGMVAACDIAIAAQDTKFSLSEVRLGIIPAVISPYIINAIGQRKARQYALTAQVFDATEAFTSGLVHYSVALDQIEMIKKQVISDILKGSPMAQTSTKKLFRQVNSLPITPELSHLTVQAIAEARASIDGREGLAAFLEKRQPNWTPPHD